MPKVFTEKGLYMLESAAWPYQGDEKPMTRFCATAMNRLAQWIAGDGAAAVNYRGMTPANIDELARAAAKVEIKAKSKDKVVPRIAKNNQEVLLISAKTDDRILGNKAFLC